MVLIASILRYLPWAHLIKTYLFCCYPHHIPSQRIIGEASAFFTPWCFRKFNLLAILHLKCKIAEKKVHHGPKISRETPETAAQESRSWLPCSGADRPEVEGVELYHPTNWLPCKSSQTSLPLIACHDLTPADSGRNSLYKLCCGVIND